MHIYITAFRLLGCYFSRRKGSIVRRTQEENRGEVPVHHRAHPSFLFFALPSLSELWNAFHEIDRNHDGRLDVGDMSAALSKAGQSSSPSLHLCELARLRFDRASSPSCSSFLLSDITLTHQTLHDFVSFLSTGKEGGASKEITWVEFRDMLLMLPRSASVPEIYRVRPSSLLPLRFPPLIPRPNSASLYLQFYQVRKRYPDGRGAARVNSDGDLSPSFPTAPQPLQPTKPKPPIPAPTTPSTTTPSSPPSVGNSSTPSSPPSTEAHHHSIAGGIIRGEDEDEDEDEDDDEWEDGNGISVDIAGKFLAAGGIAGAGSFSSFILSLLLRRVRLSDHPSFVRTRASADPLTLLSLFAPPPPITSVSRHASTVSRTATAPFDRLKVFLITDSTLPDASDIKPIVSKTFQGLENLKRATMRLYINGGGLRSFWVGNGLNV